MDNTFLSRALDEGIFEVYASPALADIPAEFKLVPENRALPVDFGDVCLNYDKAYFEQKKLQPPQTLADLTKPEYKNMLVVEYPAGSSPGLAFMLATVSALGEDRWLGFWADLKKNGVKVVEDWSTAFLTSWEKKKKISLPRDAELLVQDTQDFRRISVTLMPDDKREKTIRLNRKLLEITYPGVCPRKALIGRE